MKLQNFHVEIADWSREDQRAALLDLRDKVFIQEQGVPEARERDGLDVDCWHVLARDDAGEPIGCGRLAPTHRIGRMAVLPGWRGQGVGVALLRELLGRARAQGWSEVALDAQVSAIGFYERAGFVAYGEEFEDAGLPHRAMRLALADTGQRTQPPPRDAGVLPAAIEKISGGRDILGATTETMDRFTQYINRVEEDKEFIGKLADHIHRFFEET